MCHEEVVMHREFCSCSPQQVKQIEVTACSRHDLKLAAGMTSRMVLKIDKPLI